MNHFPIHDKRFCGGTSNQIATRHSTNPKSVTCGLCLLKAKQVAIEEEKRREAMAAAKEKVVGCQ